MMMALSVLVPASALKRWKLLARTTAEVHHHTRCNLLWKRETIPNWMTHHYLTVTEWQSTNWCVTLGRFDIATAVMTMSSFRVDKIPILLGGHETATAVQCCGVR